MGVRWTVDLYADKGMAAHRAALESFGRLVETGDGPTIHPVLAGQEKDPYEEAADKADVVAVVLRPEWSAGYINAQAAVLSGKYSAGGRRLVALIGVPSKRLAPEVRDSVRWVIY